MTEKTKNWVSRNINLQSFLLLVVAAMISAFYADYERDQKHQEDFQRDIRDKLENQDTRLIVLENVVILTNDALDEWQKQALIESARKRSGIKIQ